MEVRFPIVSYAQGELQRLQPFPTSIDGLTVGLLNNQKPNSALLLDSVLGGLRQHGRIAGVIRTTKSPPLPAPEEALGLLSAQGVDMTIIASAD